MHIKVSPCTTCPTLCYLSISGPGSISVLFLVVVQGLMYNGTKGRRQTLSLLIVLGLRPFGAVQQQKYSKGGTIGFIEVWEQI